MRDFLAWVLVGSVVATWTITPWRGEHTWRLFGVANDEELFRRFSEFPRFMYLVGLVLLTDVVAVVLALVLLF